MTVCNTCGTEFTSPFCPQCGTPAGSAAESDIAPQLAEREVVEGMRVGRDVTPAHNACAHGADDGRDPAGADFPIPDSKENATLSWDGNSPAHEAIEDADESGLPVYRKTWFWVLVTVIVVIVCCWAAWELLGHVLFAAMHPEPSIPNTVGGTNAVMVPTTLVHTGGAG